MKRALFVIPLLVAIGGGLLWLRLFSSPLGAIVHGGTGRRPWSCCTATDRSAEDWLQFESKWSLPGNTELHYLQAPLRGPWSGRRGWWWLNLNGHVPEGEAFADYSRIHPAGIQIASRRVRDLSRARKEPIMLGGFSQGAMTSAEIAFHSDQELAGLILLSGTTVE